MKNRILLIFAVLLALTLPVTPVHAQTTTVTTTTLSAVVAAKDQYVTVASATGITAQGSTGAYTTILYIDDEGMPVVSLSGTRVRVQRDTGQSHANGSKVWIAAPSAFGNGDPRRGPCAVANQPSLLIVKSRIWKCSATGATTAKWGTFDGLDPVIGTAIASDATAMAIQSQIVHITGTAELATIAVPPGLRDGQSVYLIADAAATWVATGNIGSTAATMIAGRMYRFLWDATAGKWYVN